MTPRELAVQWRTDADTLERCHAPELARVYRDHAEQVEAALRSMDDDALDLATAARESGYSVDRLRHKVTAGEIPNAGKKGAPRIRRGDLPRKARATRRGGFDAAATARDVLSITPNERTA